MLKIGWKSWTLVFLGGLTALLSYTLISQWKHASLGRQVSRNVVKFLTTHGSSIEGDVISGGMVSVPLKTHAAVNATILQMLESLDYQLGKAPHEQQAAAPPHADDDIIGEPVYSPQRARSGPQPQKKQAQAQPGEQLRRGASAPLPPTSPRPAARSSPRGASAIPQPKSPPTDDDGFTGERNPEDYQFNPNEFGGKGQQARVSVEEMMKDDDGFQ